MGSIGEVGAEDEGAIGCIRGSCVGVVVGFTWLAATIDGEAGSDDAVGFLLDEHLTTEEDSFGFDTGAGNKLEGLVGVEMFSQFLRYSCSNVGSR